jgi:hypothetical protein
VGWVVEDLAMERRSTVTEVTEESARPFSGEAAGRARLEERIELEGVAADWRRRVSELTTLVTQLRGDLRRQADEHQQKLEAIGERAVELAAENDWCDEVERELSELGVPMPEIESVGCSVLVRVSMTVTPLSRKGSREVSGWVEEQLTVDSDGQLGFDNSMVDVSFEEASIERVDS